MEKNVNQPLLNRDPCAKELIELLCENEGRLGLSDSLLYHNFPLYRNDDDTTAVARVMIISRNHGVVVFDYTDKTERTLMQTDATTLREELEQIHSLIYSDLVKSKLLRTGIATINVPVLAVLFVPRFTGDIGVFRDECDGLEIIRDSAELQVFLDNMRLDAALDETRLREVVAILEGSKGIVRPKQRPGDTTGGTRGRVLDSIESQIANFDVEQKRAALITLDSPQRIRGLAGSGKTIILTMKAALIHLQNPEAELFYTFSTRSLYSLIVQLITRFYRRFSGRDPNWDKLRVLHAWGGENLPGVYYVTCLANNVDPVPFGNVKHRKDPFAEVCGRLAAVELEQHYDYAIMDEGQDFPSESYRLCRRITKNDRVIWGYDECQNIFDISIQDTKETFGKDLGGNYYIDFSQLPAGSLQDLVLHQCYRNPRRVLVSAFAIGLGIYNERILQMPENNDHWEDIGFHVYQGRSEVGDNMVITRPQENSPLVKNELLESEDVVQVAVFDSFDDECKHVADKIADDIRQDLLPEDILVISLDDRHARVYFKAISAKLRAQGIRSFNILDAPFYSKDFYLKGHVTLTTVYRAKGNEAGSVYVVGVDSVFEKKDSIRERNRIFTAMSRAKAWVTVTGVGTRAEKFRQEMELVNRDYPELKFVMPDPGSLKVFQRDLSSSQAQLNKIRRDLEDIAKRTGLPKDELISMLVDTEKGEG